MAATLPITSNSEKSLILNDDEEDGVTAHIMLRNRCLGLMHTMLFTRNNVSVMVCDEIARNLGFDWILLFMQPHLHSTTVIWALRILIVMCSIPALMNRYVIFFVEMDSFQMGIFAGRLGTSSSRIFSNFSNVERK